jgi:hypothetical protein
MICKEIDQWCYHQVCWYARNNIDDVCINYRYLKGGIDDDYVNFTDKQRRVLEVISSTPPSKGREYQRGS